MKKFTIPEMDYILNLKEALKNVKANELVTNAEEQVWSTETKHTDCYWEATG